MTRIRNTSRGNVAHITGSFLSPRFGRKRHNDCTNKTPLYSRADAHVAKLKEPIARLPGGIATVIAGATASKYISGNCFINSKSRAMKSKLTPFDGELLVMIADIMKVEPTVEESATTYTISVPIGDNTPDTVTAMQNAVRGRLGKRLIMFEDVDNCKRYSVAYVDDAESMADEIRTEYDAPDATAGTRYCRTLKEVDAIQVDRDNLETLKRFTGGGTMTIPRTPGGRIDGNIRKGNCRRQYCSVCTTTPRGQKAQLINFSTYASIIQKKIISMHHKVGSKGKAPGKQK